VNRLRRNHRHDKTINRDAHYTAQEERILFPREIEHGSEQKKDGRGKLGAV
jgi:hypothetical protein